MSNLVKHQAYTPEDAEAEATDMDRAQADFMKLGEGRTVIRILPALVGKGYGPNKTSPFKTVWTHFLSKPLSSETLSTACPSRELNQPCMACEMANKLKAKGNKIDTDRAYQLFPKRRVYMCVIDREAPEKGVQVLGVGKTIHESLTKIRKDVDAGGDFTDPGPEGFDIIIERKGSGLITEYTVMPARKPSPLGNMEWVEQVPNLDVFAKVKVEKLTEFFGLPAVEEKQISSKSKSRTAADDMGDIEV